jgi:Ca2+-binding EF-hand superfamily protein
VTQQEVENYISAQDERMIAEDLRNQCSQVFSELDPLKTGLMAASEIGHAVEMIVGQLKTDAQINIQMIQEFVEEVENNRDGKINEAELYELILGMFASEEGGEEEEAGEGPSEEQVDASRDEEMI